MGGLGAVGALGAFGAPGAVGAVGAAGAAGAGASRSSKPSVEDLQNGHLLGSSPLTRLIRLPQFGQRTGPLPPASAGLKHMVIPLSIRDFAFFNGDDAHVRNASVRAFPRCAITVSMVNPHTEKRQFEKFHYLNLFGISDNIIYRIMVFI